MIKQYSLYNEDGKILFSAIGEMDDLELGSNYVIEEYYDPNKYYIDVKNNKAIEIPEQPSENHKFNYKTKQWELFVPIENIEQEVKWKRNLLLQQSDWTQIPNNPLTTEKQQEWATYRQELRDITNQTGYPFDVVWPVPPS